MGPPELHGYTASTRGSSSIIKSAKSEKGLQQAPQNDLLPNTFDFPDRMNEVWTTRSITIPWPCQGSGTLRHQNSTGT